MKHFFDIINISNERIICDINFRGIVDFYTDKTSYIKKFFDNQRNIPEYVWSILTSGKYSIYSKKMNPIIAENNLSYISSCVNKNIPIKIILAGLPGKCANRKKVFSYLPDLGEFVMLARFEQINNLIKSVYSPGIEVMFMSDYVGLKQTFFPNVNEIKEYVDVIYDWKRFFSYNFEINYITDILPEIKAFEDYFINEEVPELIKNENYNYLIEEQLLNSIKDNIDIENAKQFYKNNYHISIDESILLKISAIYYKKFWDFFSKMNAVQNFYGKVLYASPVAYHPNRRLCIRLQSRKARIAPWNGVGYINKNEIYSVDQRKCESKGCIKVYDRENYFWGYIENYN